MNSLDLYGIGPLFKGLSLAFLCYLVIFKNYKIPILFFILYGIGSLAFVTHLLTIKDKHLPIVVDAGIYEQYINIFLCLATVFVILTK